MKEPVFYCEHLGLSCDTGESWDGSGICIYTECGGYDVDCESRQYCNPYGCQEGYYDEIEGIDYRCREAPTPTITPTLYPSVTPIPTPTMWPTSTPSDCIKSRQPCNLVFDKCCPGLRCVADGDKLVKGHCFRDDPLDVCMGYKEEDCVDDDDCCYPLQCIIKRDIYGNIKSLKCL